MATVSSEAFELDTYETEKPRLRALNSPQKSAEIQKKQAQRVNGVRAAYTVFFALLLIVAAAWMIVLRVRVTELSDQNAAYEEELAILMSEESRLRNELSAKTSAEAVDQYIEDHNMSKTKSDQIEYFTVEEGESIEVSDPEP